MKTGTFIVEVVLEEDWDSYHGELIDFEKDLNGKVADIHRVIAWKVTNDASGESYLGRYPKTVRSVREV